MADAVKRLALCFDGTWNTDRCNTNVSRLFRKIAGPGTGCPEQRQFYDEGVGTRWMERIRGGMLGMGLDRNIRQGYAWLAEHFAHAAAPWEAGPPSEPAFVPGPDIYLFGFSRGAFTARSLGGLVNYLGLPRLDPAPRERRTRREDLDVIRGAWKLYSERPTSDERRELKEGSASSALQAKAKAHDEEVQAFREHHLYPVRIHFIGVWDTVGALGIPRVLDYKWLPRPSTQYLFHDTQLGRCVRFAYQAAAIDEHRAAYPITLWTKPDHDGTEAVEQRWFPGAHADVGGGYEDNLLPDPPLAWLATMAAERGLHFVNDRGAIDPATHLPYASLPRPPAAFELDGREHHSPVHDSYAAFMGGTYRALRTLPGAGGRAYRRMLVEDDGMNQTVDSTAYRKLDEDTSYRPHNLAQAGRNT